MPSPAEEALKATIGELATRTHLETLKAGREVVAKSAKRWRRVTDGKPCGFCAMLASRGPVYGSARDAGQGNAYHGRCGCTVEPFEGDSDDWVPTADEQRYIDAYNAVHRSGMSPDDLAAAIEKWLTDNPAQALARKIDWASAKTPAEIGEMLRGLLGSRGTVSGFDHPSLSLGKVKTSAETVERLISKYPEVKFDLNVETIKGKAVAQAVLNRGLRGEPDTYSLNLNRSILTARSKTDDMYKRAAETGFWSIREGVKSDAMTHTVTHEFGHLIDYTTGNYMRYRQGGSISVRKIAKEVAERQGLTEPAEHFLWRSPRADPVKVQEYHDWNAFMDSQMSGYAQTDIKEGMAEAFADVEINGDKASETNQIAVRRLIALLQGGLRMRPFPFEPMDADEFAAALDAARRGVTLTDQGANDEVGLALDAVADAAPNPPQSLLDAAYRAYRAQ